MSTTFPIPIFDGLIVNNAATFVNGPVSLPTNTTGPFLPLSAGVVSIAASGAAGDGTTDDQPKIQAYLNTVSANGGGQVLLEPGKWYAITSATLTIPANVWVCGSYNAFGSNLGGNFFSGGGFLINPLLPSGIIFSNTGSLTNTKVYRQGLVANATVLQVNSAVAQWATEAVRLVTTAPTTTSAVLTFAATTGVVVGQAVHATGITSFPIVTVASVATTTVTLSAAISVASGTTVRFGGSIGVVNPFTVTGVVLDQLKIIGFNTGVYTETAQYFYSRIEADNIYNFDFSWGGDGAWMRDIHCIPWYGQSIPAIGLRPGDSFFFHDGGLGLAIENVENFGWVNGYHCKNVSGPNLINCQTEVATQYSTSTKGFWVEDSSNAISLTKCHAQAQTVGYHVTDSTIVLLKDCEAFSAPASGGTSHYLIEGPTVPVRCEISNCTSYGTSSGEPSFIFDPGVVYCRFRPGAIIAPGANPPIQIDPSVSNNIHRVSTADANGFGTGQIQTYFGEKVYIKGAGSATTDGSPTGSLTVQLQDSLSAQAQIISIIRNNGQVLSLEATSTDAYILPANNISFGATNRLVNILGQLNLVEWQQDTATLYETPVSGATFTTPSFYSMLVINPISPPIATLTIVMPTFGNEPLVPPLDGQKFTIRIVGPTAGATNITALTLTTTDSTSILPPVSGLAMTAGTSMDFRFNALRNQWFRG